MLLFTKPNWIAKKASKLFARYSALRIICSVSHFFCTIPHVHRRERTSALLRKRSLRDRAKVVDEVSEKPGEMQTVLKSSPEYCLTEKNRVLSYFIDAFLFILVSSSHFPIPAENRCKLLRMRNTVFFPSQSELTISELTLAAHSFIKRPKIKNIWLILARRGLPKAKTRLWWIFPSAILSLCG